MSKEILVIGGAGFIGSHLVDKLLEKNHVVTVYDSLESQVHGNISTPPPYLSENIKFIKDDIRNQKELLKSLEDIEVIVNLAAMVGVGQSMYQIDKYVDINVLGTARLLDLLVNKPNDVRKVIVASSMSTYGEGAYLCEDCGEVNPELRKTPQLERGDWEMNCPICGKKAKPIPTDENKPQDCTSIYALTKKEQEKMSLLVGETYGINTTALRLFNVYGSRQSLSNPYTGVCAIFSSSLLCGNPPTIFEDGEQTRDFIHINDICQSFLLSMEKPLAKNEIFNVGAGKPISILNVAKKLAEYINPQIKPIITNQFRPGDIRHCVSDISKISSKLGFNPEYSFDDGMKELIQWVRLQEGKIEDKSSLALKELKNKGLLK
ncbi:MAG: NAD-dependent epimerase/dehydratase family protein [Candidatus Lokiarchaeota archaeon]|nr:NAD-dependent epimerase/dehydratase family protein [Candidatus Lokiarchaeota archaeon]